MKYYLLLFSILAINAISHSQKLECKKLNKPSLDTSVFNNWPSIYRFGISDDGMFAYFTTTKGRNLRKENLAIKSLYSDWEANVLDVKGTIKFTKDNKKIVCMNSGDSMIIINLGTPEISYISHVRFFNIFTISTSEYIVYQKKSPTNDLVFNNIRNGSEVAFKKVIDYLLDTVGNALIIKIDSVINGQRRQILSWNSLVRPVGNRIFEGDVLSNLVLNKKGNELAFIREDSNSKSIWLYKHGNNLIQLLFDSNTTTIGQEMQLGTISGFSEDGSRLFIYLKERPPTSSKHSLANLNVWSFTDAVVQSRQPTNYFAESYLAVIDLTDNKIIRLQFKNDKIIPTGNNYDKHLYLICHEGDSREEYWNDAAKYKSFLISTTDGSRRKLDYSFKDPKISPYGKYLVGYDKYFRDLLLYDIKTEKYFNLTKNLPINLPAETLQREGGDRPSAKFSRGLGFGAWEEGEKILVYDEFDIWEIDLKSDCPPLNITNGFGRKNKIQFRLSELHDNKILSDSETLIISSFDRLTKKSGYYKIISRKNTNPQMLSVANQKFTSIINVESPIKAKEAEIYLLLKESTSESPNLFWTRDFRKFTRVSSIFPEKEYNWITSELMSFKTLDGRTEWCVLYKPLNFDKQKQYPAIIHYYENKSNELNKFHRPGGDGDGGQLDIAWFVSHGYIVMTPDIHYKIGEPGRSVYNSVIASSNSLKKLPFVNPKKIGIQGHSWGGYETNYLVANSTIFAAAISSSAPSNFITGYLSDNPNEQAHCEVNQFRLGKSLWEDIPMYLDNSPVFKAYNVTTPILTIANRRDNNVPFIQGLQWFMALRRLGKRAWMLQYDDGGHGVDGNDYIDYVIRSTQFFDHYLKDSACPRWMLFGISASQKEVDNGLELVLEKDKNGKWLGPKEGGLLTEEQRKKVKALQKRE